MENLVVERDPSEVFHIAFLGIYGTVSGRVYVLQQIIETYVETGNKSPVTSD